MYTKGLENDQKHLANLGHNMSISCITCGREIPADATKCPGCGEPGPDRKIVDSWEEALALPSNRPVEPDAALAQIVGSASLLREDLTKRLWEYIKLHGLRDPKEPTIIHADEKLLPVFGGRASVSIFEMTRWLGAHVR